MRLDADFQVKYPHFPPPGFCVKEVLLFLDLVWKMQEVGHMNVCIHAISYELSWTCSCLNNIRPILCDITIGVYCEVIPSLSNDTFHEW